MRCSRALWAGRNRGCRRWNAAKRAIDSHAVLTRLAEIVHLDITDLIDQPSAGENDVRRYSAVSGIEQAVINYPALAGAISSAARSRPAASTNLLGRIAMVYSRYQATQYEQAGRLLPTLIRDVEISSRAPGGSAPAVCRARTLVYDTTAALLNRVGEHSLAWAAADRSLTAAGQSGQRLLAALAAYRLAYVLASRHHPSDALEIAMAAAAALEPAMASTSDDQLSVYGALHLAAATAAAAQYDRSLTPVLLRTASAVAERLGRNTNLMWTAFGPANVAIHAVSVSVRLGDPRTAVHLGESLDVSQIPQELTGRRTQILLDLACAYAMRRQDAAAVNTVLEAERRSPQLVRFDASTHDLLTGLLRREHRASTPQLRPLARRVGAI
jgi:hypothetical protein